MLDPASRAATPSTPADPPRPPSIPPTPPVLNPLDTVMQNAAYLKASVKNLEKSGVSVHHELKQVIEERLEITWLGTSLHRAMGTNSHQIISKCLAEVAQVPLFNG